MSGRGLGPATDVTVSVSATVTLPLHLKALETLEDAALEDDILKEAVRLAVAEKLGGFENMRVDVSHKHGKPSFEAKLEFADLCSAIVNAQHIYEHAMTQLLVIQEMIQAERTGQEQKAGKLEENCANVLASIDDVVQQALKGPGEAPFAAAIRECAQASSTTAGVGSDDWKTSGGKNDDGGTATSSDDRSYDPLAEGYEPLLDHVDSESENREEEEDAAPLFSC